MLNTKEAAAYLFDRGVIKSSDEKSQRNILNRWVNEGKIEGIRGENRRVGLRFELSELERFVQERIETDIIVQRLNQNNNNVGKEENNNDVVAELERQISRLKKENEELREVLKTIEPVKTGKMSVKTKAYSLMKQQKKMVEAAFRSHLIDYKEFYKVPDAHRNGYLIGMEHGWEIYERIHEGILEGNMDDEKYYKLIHGKRLK